MAKKKKKTSRALMILVLVLTLVWAIVSCGNNNNTPEADYAFKIEENGLDKQEETEEKVTEKEQDVEAIEEENKQDEDIQGEEPEVNEEIPQGSDIEQFDTSLDTTLLSNEKKGWWFRRNTEHKQPSAQNEIHLSKYGSYYLVDTDEKVFYLTLDSGYENGYTEVILDTLKDNEVQALFFVTKPYIRDNPEIATRMKQEGHLVGNHTVSHKSMPTLTDEEIEYELEETARYFEEVTGYQMDPFFRPPMGEYSERTLYIARKLGYRNIFWSLTYKDWDTKNQPGAEFAYNHVMDNYHPGAIALLHSVSKSNAEALDDIIKSLKEKGYRFGNMYEVE